MHLLIIFSQIYFIFLHKQPLRSKSSQDWIEIQSNELFFLFLNAVFEELNSDKFK